MKTKDKIAIVVLVIYLTSMLSVIYIMEKECWNSFISCWVK